MAYLDFQKIKEEHSIEDVAIRLGLELKKNGNQLRGECFSGEGGKRALVITPEKRAWYSFGLQKGGDVIELVSQVNGLSPKDAAMWIAGDAEPEKKKPVEPDKKVVEKQERGFQPLDYLQADHPAVEALGFDPSFASSVGIGYAPRGVLRGTIAIPVRDASGKLLGYIGVTEAKLPPKWST